jgi:hypothetical protein
MLRHAAVTLLVAVFAPLLKLCRMEGYAMIRFNAVELTPRVLRTERVPLLLARNVSISTIVAGVALEPTTNTIAAATADATF